MLDDVLDGEVDIENSVYIARIILRVVILDFSKGVSLWKNPIWHPQNESLYKRSFRSFEPSITWSNIFSYSIWQKSIKTKLSSFDSKLWVFKGVKTPLEKSNMTPPKWKSLYTLFSVGLTSSSIFLILFWQKTINKKFSNFHAKWWVKPFRKIQYGTPKIKVFINALFDLFNRLKHRQSSFLIPFKQKTIKKKFSNFD